MNYMHLSEKNTPAALMIAVLLAAAFFSCHSTEQRSSSGLPGIKKGATPFLESDSAESRIAALPGNAIVTLYAHSSLYKAPDSAQSNRRFLLDGEAFFKIPSTDTPFIIHTGMLNLITRHAYFHVNAHREDAGQSVELLRGKLIAEKAYPSDYPDTETLHAGDMVMINKDIDLMEKETFDTTALSTRIIEEKAVK